MGGLSEFQRGQIVGARLAGASVTKKATLLGVSREAVSKVMTSSAKRNSGRKQTRSERNCRTLKKMASKIVELLQER